MTKKNVLKITPILVLLNVIIIIIIVAFYLSRLVKYYKIEHRPNETITFADRLIQKQEYINLTNGLIKKDNTYVYIGKDVNNYVMYSGMLFRIISIDENKNIKMISNDTLTLLYSGLEKGYNDSYVNKWLNEIYGNTFFESERLLSNSLMCEDVIDSLDNITCNNINKDNKIILPSLNDYKFSGGENSFINNGKDFYLSSLDQNNNNYYINKEGQIGLNEITTKIYGVRPVITINGSINLLSGNGSVEDPYLVEKHDILKLSDTYVGNIISIDNNNYKVVSKEEDKVKLVLDGVLLNDEKELELIFDSKSSIYNNSSIYKYLNDNYLNKLSIKDSIIKSNWGTNKLTLDNLDYSNINKSVISSNIGMLNLGDFFVGDYNNTYTLTRGIENDDIINIINENGNVYGDMVTSKHYVRPSFYLDGETNIISGVGNDIAPYELGGIDEEE